MVFSRNLKINYGTIKDVASEADKLANNINSIRSSLNSIDGIVKQCNGSAAEALQEKGPKIVESLDKLEDGLTGMSKIFNEYVDTMSGIISYGDGGINSIVHVNTDQVRRKLDDMIRIIQSFEHFAKSANPYISMTNLYMPGVNEAERTATLECNKQLEYIKELMQTAASGIVVFETDFETARKIVKDFENMDDTFKGKIKDVYYDFADIKWYQTTTFKFIASATILIAAAVFIVVIAPATAGGAAVIFATGVAKNVIAVGLLNAAVAATSAAISGENMADAVATGLFEGCIEGAVVGTANEVGALFRASKYATSLMSKTGMTEKTLKEVSKLGTEYVGKIATDVTNNVYNGKEVNMGDIVEKETKNIAWKAVDNNISSAINDKYAKKAAEIYKEYENSWDIGDMAQKVLKNDIQKKATQYGASMATYSGALVYDGMGAAYEEKAETGDYEIKNISDYCTSEFDYSKLGKSVFKDEFKENVKSTLDKMAKMRSHN